MARELRIERDGFYYIKAGITKKVGEYKWCMSSGNLECSMLNYELVKSTKFDADLDEKEEETIEKIYSTKLKIQNNVVKKIEIYPLESYFANYSREIAITRAINDGYKQSQIAKYLRLSHVAILYIDDIDDDIDYLEPIESLDKKEIRDFFQNKLDKII